MSRTKQGIDTVVAVGGDGKLSLVVNGILRKKKYSPCEAHFKPS